jgi:4-amino-4-deoxy-L-arabinose transferase-like glycosyltransferase
MMLAFRVSVAAVERQSLWWTSAAGLLSASAAASSLLTATVAPVLMIWILRQTPARNRNRRFFTFLAGAAVPFLPVLGLLYRSPRAVFFNLIQYQLLYRRTNWEDATPHDLEVLTSWLYSLTAFLLGSLCVLGLWFIAKRAPWKGSIRSGFYLCGWLGLATGAELCATHPTFPSYWVLVTPFLAIPAAAGLYAVSTLIRSPARRWWPVPILLVLLLAGLSWSLYKDRNRLTWGDMERVARKVNEVTAPGASLWADEQVYFLTRRSPAEGTEFSYAEVIDLPEDVAGPLHIVSDNLLDRHAAAGMFSTVSTCEDQEVIEHLNLPRLFLQKSAIGSCTVFWDPARHPALR